MTDSLKVGDSVKVINGTSYQGKVGVILKKDVSSFSDSSESLVTFLQNGHREWIYDSHLARVEISIKLTFKTDELLKQDIIRFEGSLFKVVSDTEHGVSIEDMTNRQRSSINDDDLERGCVIIGNMGGDACD
jgi:hypothetical protein